ncbi:hypothetical protein OESDEN_16463 [Oesophagostomum dentatum]|uniref:Uncharacterized protein n=1 Tax=Oesophagostomum dentatum TaxID=61180 RepID=A0A0B1SET6_OESDE|nr:hypothetical protein OESDEN_16463 [Oesophagostomum dentatum]
MNEPLDIWWSSVVRKAEVNCDVTWLPPEHPFALIPEWTPKLQLRTISTGALLHAVEEYSKATISFCLSLAHPYTPLGLVGLLAPWFVHGVMRVFEKKIL